MRTLPAMNALVVGDESGSDTHEVIKVKIGRDPSRDVPRLRSVLEPLATLPASLGWQPAYEFGAGAGSGFISAS